MNRFLCLVGQKLPWIVIGVVFLWSAISIFIRHSGVASAGGITLRIGHWQLEAGVREGFSEAAAEYHKLHPDVRILQEAIPESTYSQWLNTQLMGGTAPDIIEAGLLAPTQMTAAYTRYLLPVTSSVSQSNPYNAGTDLEGVPLIQTFKDGMRRSYINEIKEYMNIPLGLWTIRLFYNKQLLKKLTGLDDAPKDFRGFLDACRKIQSQKQSNGQNYIPIAGSIFHYKGWSQSLIEPLTYGAWRQMDFNRDGLFSKDEMFLGFISGKIDFTNPAYEGSFKMIRDITRYFSNGWTGLTRDEAVFNFAQQKAVFISTGLWEIEGIQQQAAGTFDLGVMDFPLPSKSDQEYGGIIEGHRYENPEGGMPMAITRNSRHPEVALDFLLFLVSRAQNEKFNKRLKWIPIILGAKTAPGLEIFEPTLEGVGPAFDPSIGPESQIKWQQIFALYLINQISYKDMAAEFTRFYTTKGREDFQEYLRNRKRGQILDGQLIESLRERALSEKGINDRADWEQYRDAVQGRWLANEVFFISQSKALADPMSLTRKSFYKYTPEAMNKVRSSLGIPSPTPVSAVSH